jgi:hypothetical protein
MGTLLVRINWEKYGKTISDTKFRLDNELYLLINILTASLKTFPNEREKEYSLALEHKETWNYNKLDFTADTDRPKDTVSRL